MTGILPTIVRYILCAAGVIFIFLGLHLKGFFRENWHRRKAIQSIIFILTGLIILVLMGSGTGVFTFPAGKVMGAIVVPSIAMGRFISGWFPLHSRAITIIFLSLILVTTLLTTIFKKNESYPLILLLFSLGTALLGGLSLSRGVMGQAYFFLGISFLYGWSSGLIDREKKFVQINWITAAIILALIILLGFFLRSYALEDIPYRFDHYESDYGREALTVLSGHHNVNFWTSTIWRGLGHLNYSPVYVYYVALFFQLFGATLLTLKMVAVTWGIFALLLTYGIVSTLFSRRLALITVFLLAISPLHINYSRTGLLLISTQAVSLLVVYLLLRAIIRKKLLSYILLGIAISFAGYFYSPAKYPVLLAGFLIVCYGIFKRRWFLRNLAGIILLVLTVIILMTTLNIPAWDVMAPKFAGYESVWHRTRDHRHTNQADYIRGIPLVQENLEKLIHSFFISRNFNYNPWPRGNLYFNPLIPPLFLLGIAFSLSRIKKANYRLLLFFTAAFLIPNLLSRPPVMVRRLMVAWPFIYCLAAIPLSQLLRQSGKLGGRIGTGLAAVPIVAILLAVGADNSLVYFDSNEPAGRWEEERFYDEYAKDLINDYYLYLVPISGLSRKTISFILYETKGAGSRGFKYVSPEQIRNLKWEDISSRLPAALLCSPGKVFRSDLEELQRRFGRGRIEEFKDKFNRRRAVSLFLEE